MQERILLSISPSFSASPNVDFLCWFIFSASVKAHLWTLEGTGYFQTNLSSLRLLRRPIQVRPVPWYNCEYTFSSDGIRIQCIPQARWNNECRGAALHVVEYNWQFATVQGGLWHSAHPQIRLLHYFDHSKRFTISNMKNMALVSFSHSVDAIRIRSIVGECIFKNGYIFVRGTTH